MQMPEAVWYTSPYSSGFAAEWRAADDRQKYLINGRPR